MTPQVQETATQTLLNLGLPGVCILALAGAIVWLVRQNGKLQEKLDSEHEARLNDRKADTETLLGAHDQLHKSLEIVDKALDHLNH
jgi:hypothetical protein